MKQRRTPWKTKRLRAERVTHFGKFIDKMTRTHSQQILVSSTLFQPALRCFLHTAHRSFRPYPSHAVFVANTQTHFRRSLSLMRLVIRWDCHVTSFACATWDVCSFSLHSTEISSVVLTKSNRYTNQRSINRLEVNEYQHRLCYKTTILDVFTLFGCMCCWSASRVVCQ